MPRLGAPRWYPPKLRAIVWLAVTAALVSGCLPTHSPAGLSSRRNCLNDNAKFSDAWACIKAQLTARQQGDGDSKRDGLIEEGDLLAEQVRAGKVSDADARRRLSAGMAHEIGQ